MTEDTYRVTHQVVTNLPLTSKQKFHYGQPVLSCPGQNGTFVLMSSGGSSLPDVSPCITAPLTHATVSVSADGDRARICTRLPVAPVAFLTVGLAFKWAKVSLNVNTL